jgi:hypothetical protein
MAPPAAPSPDQPLGSFEYEVTDDLAAQSAVVFYQSQIQHVKEGLPQKGVTAPVTSLATVMATLLFAIGLALFSLDNSALKWMLIGVACLVLLVLSFKAALYYLPAFTRWYARRGALRAVRKLPDRHVRWTFYEDRIETQTGTVERIVPWGDVRRVLALPDFWFLGLNSGTILSIPVQVLRDDLQTLIGRRAGEAGALLEHRPLPAESSVTD